MELVMTSFSPKNFSLSQFSFRSMLASKTPRQTEVCRTIDLTFPFWRAPQPNRACALWHDRVPPARRTSMDRLCRLDRHVDENPALNLTTRTHRFVCPLLTE